VALFGYRYATPSYTTTYAYGSPFASGDKQRFRHPETPSCAKLPELMAAKLSELMLMPAPRRGNLQIAHTLRFLAS
jgi:hypothetical protein